jgi:alpha-L-rhamnosidase
MWRTIVGLSPDEQAPGFERFVVAPRPGGGLRSASGTYESIRGPIRIAWTIREGVFTLHLSVPPNSEAIVRLPSPGASEVRAGSGEHVFRSRR